MRNWPLAAFALVLASAATARGATEPEEAPSSASPVATTAPVAPPPPPLPDAPHLMPDTTMEPTPGFGANLGVGFSFLSKPPDMTLETPDGGAMSQFAGDPLRHQAWMPMVAISASVFYRTGSIVKLPLLGFELGIPVSTGYPASVNLGTKKAPLAWVRGGPTFYDGFDFLGFGLELSPGSFRFGLDVSPGFRFVRTTGTITQGALTIDAEAHEYSFSLRAEVKGCAGTKAAFSVCLFAAPHVFEFGSWLNGAVFGARVETN